MRLDRVRGEENTNKPARQWSRADYLGNPVGDTLMETVRALCVVLATASLVLSVGAAEPSIRPATKPSTQPAVTVTEEARAVFLKGINVCELGGGIPNSRSTSEDQAIILVEGFVPAGGGKEVSIKDIGLVDAKGRIGYLLGAVMATGLGFDYESAYRLPTIVSTSPAGSVRMPFAFQFDVGKTALKEPLIFKVVGREDQKVVILPDDTVWCIEALQSEDKKMRTQGADKLKTRKDQAKTSLPALKSALAKEKDADVQRHLEAAIKELGG